MNDTSKSFDLLREQIFQAIKDAGNVQEALVAFRDGYFLGNVTYHMAQTVPGEVQVDAPYVRTTYSPEWVSHYLLKGYVNVDPVVKEGLLRTLPFDWSEMEPTPGAAEMMMDFSAHGFGTDGYSIPVTDKVGRRALLSVNSKPDTTNWAELVQAYRQDWVELAHVLHRKAALEQYGDDDPAPVLSPRELETLYWTAQGKDYKEIALIVGISEHTVRTYMRSSRYKLDCSNMSQAVAKAVKLRLINT